MEYISYHSDLPYETHTITTADGVKLHSWLLLQPHSTQCPTLIFFHGNAGNIGFRLPNANHLYRICECNVFLIEYRGYGDSEGIPSESGLQLDAKAAIQYAQRLHQINQQKIFLFGRSLGGAVALHTAHTHGDALSGVIVENTFTSISDMVHTLMGQLLNQPIPNSIKMPLDYFLRVFLTNHWRTKDIIGEVRTPILFISGLRDELVPPAHMASLHANALACPYKEWYEVADGTHNDTFMRDGQNYYQRIRAFMQSRL